MMNCTPEHGSLSLENIFFDNDQDGSNPPDPRQVTVESDHTNAETCSLPGTARESSSEAFSQ